jgi:sensor histidine kinase YesM
MPQTTNNPENNFILPFLLNKRWAVMRHILFVSILLLQFGFLTNDIQKYAKMVGVKYEIFFAGQLIDVVISITLIYVNLYILFPRFLKKGLYLKFFIWAIVLCTFSYFESFIIERIYVLYFGKNEKYALHLNWMDYAESMLAAFVYVIATTGYRVFKSWVIDQQRFAALEKEKTNSELEQLKNQINPHFLFNTLNNLHILTLTDPPKASNIILGLSDVLRYQIYDSQNDKVLLKKDIEIMEQYLELEKIRRDNLTVNVRIEGNKNGILIPPLLFTNFIDNAIKHSNNRGGSFIKILFVVSKMDLFFEITNSKSDQNNVLEKNGLGLSNAKKRLNLLYGDAHRLEITELENTYNVKLNIPL